MKTIKTKIVGIDPAPKKGLQTFDGCNSSSYEIKECSDFIKQLLKEKSILVCWDAPMTGPPASVVSEAKKAFGSVYTKRPIERFFSTSGRTYGSGTSDFKTPPGISVRSYSGCPHWTISRALIGLPRLGVYDSNDPPFSLVTSDSMRKKIIRNVVEVHPAVAIWLWCRDSDEMKAENTNWFYKPKSNTTKLNCKNNISKFWKILLEKPFIREIIKDDSAPSNDDDLDARVSYILGRLWLDEPHEVKLLGDGDSGAFLLPAYKGMSDKFAAFIESRREKRQAS